MSACLRNQRAGHVLPDTTDIADTDQLDESAKIIMAKAARSYRIFSAVAVMSRCCTGLCARGYVDDFRVCALPCRMSQAYSSPTCQAYMRWVVC